VGVLRKPFKLPGKVAAVTATRRLSPTHKIGSSDMGKSQYKDKNDVPQQEEEVAMFSCKSHLVFLFYQFVWKCSSVASEPPRNGDAVRIAQLTEDSGSLYVFRGMDNDETKF
jgi:hypothetical protein